MSKPLPRTLVCIDGPAGSGKTTLANRLASLEADVAVVHMDDLYRGWQEPLGQDFAALILRTIVEPWLARTPIRFQRYDWLSQQLGEWVELGHPRVLILEGVGAASDGVRQHAAAVYFLEVEPETAIQRVVARDGAGVAAELERWQQKEARHFLVDETREAATVIVAAEAVSRPQPQE